MADGTLFCHKCGCGDIMPAFIPSTTLTRPLGTQVAQLQLPRRKMEDLYEQVVLARAPATPLRRCTRLASQP
jgi:hypothetical protein